MKRIISPKPTFITPELSYLYAYCEKHFRVVRTSTSALNVFVFIPLIYQQVMRPSRYHYK